VNFNQPFPAKVECDFQQVGCFVNVCSNILRLVASFSTAHYDFFSAINDNPDTIFAYPTITRIFAALDAIEAFSKAAPPQQPDATA
jgi:hypothetical protein